MIRYYSSRSNNTARFVAALNLQAESIPHAPTGPYILITPTVGDGDCPEPVIAFLARHAHLCHGAIIGGNRNFGASFGGAGKVIQQRFGIRTLYKFELAGTQHDIDRCREGILNCLK